MMKEADLQKLILDWLNAKGHFHYRNNTGAMPRTTNGKRYYVRFGAKGSPDIIAVIKGQYVGIEVKGPKGKQSPDQRVFQVRLETAGGKYILAHSLEDVIDNI